MNKEDIKEYFEKVKKWLDEEKYSVIKDTLLVEKILEIMESLDFINNERYFINFNTISENGSLQGIKTNNIRIKLWKK